MPLNLKNVPVYGMEGTSASASPVAQSPQSFQTTRARFKEMTCTELLPVTKFLPIRDSLKFALTLKAAHEAFNYRIHQTVQELWGSFKENPHLPNVFKLLPTQEITEDNSGEIFKKIIGICRTIQNLANPLVSQPTAASETQALLVSAKKDPLPTNAKEIECLFNWRLDLLASEIKSCVSETSKYSCCESDAFRLKSMMLILTSKEEATYVSFEKGLLRLSKEIDENPTLALKYFLSESKSAERFFLLRKFIQFDQTQENKDKALESILAESDPFLKVLMLIKFTQSYPTQANRDIALQHILAFSGIEPGKEFLFLVWARMYLTPENSRAALEAILKMPDIDTNKELGESKLFLLLELLKTYPTPKIKEAAREAVLDAKIPWLALDLLKIDFTPENSKAVREIIRKAKDPEAAFELLKIDPTPENSEVASECALTGRHDDSCLERNVRVHYLIKQAELLISKKMIYEALKAISAISNSPYSKIKLLREIFNMAC